MPARELCGDIPKGVEPLEQAELKVCPNRMDCVVLDLLFHTKRVMSSL